MGEEAGYMNGMKLIKYWLILGWKSGRLKLLNNI
jgi:hypothetical protein